MTSEAWLSGSRGQALAVSIGLGVLGVIWFGVVDPARSWFRERGALLEQRQELLLHMRDLVASLPALRAASAGKSGGGIDTATVLLPGESDSVAAADLQEQVQSMAADAGTSLTAVETLPPEGEAGGWHKIALRISLNASWPVLMGMIRSIEQSRTRIFIDDLHFRSPVAVSHPTELPIQASMVIYGFRPDAGGGA